MSSRRLMSPFLIAVIVFASMAVPAGATSILITDRDAWTSASSSVTTIDFEGLATPAVPGNYSNASGLFLGGVQFIGLTPPDSFYLYAEDPAAATNYNWNSGDVLMGPSAAWGAGYLQVNLPAGATAVGADLMSHTPFADTFTVSLSTGETFTVATSSRPQRAFAGFISDTPLTSVRFRPYTGVPMVDNFSWGSAAATETPEIVTMLMGGSGLLLLLLARLLCRARG